MCTEINMNQVILSVHELPTPEDYEGTPLSRLIFSSNRLDM